MGYEMRLVNVDWKIPTSSVEPIMNEIKELSAKQDLDWVDTDELLEAKDFIEFMDILRYEISQNDDFFIIKDFFGDKLGSDEEIFRIIAKYSFAGNYIKFYGENGESWYWTVTDEFSLKEDFLDLDAYDWRTNDFKMVKSC